MRKNRHRVSRTRLRLADHLRRVNVKLSDVKAVKSFSVFSILFLVERLNLRVSIETALVIIDKNGL